MWDLEKLTVVQIRSLVEETDTLTDEEITALMADERISVQRLGSSVHRRQRVLAQKSFNQRRLYRVRDLLYQRGYRQIAGIDEAGRGPLAGPVVAAAVILPPGMACLGIRDSKQLSEAQREHLYSEIEKTAIAVGIGIVEPRRIDELNIHHAALEAMGKAIATLEPRPDVCLIDGRFTIKDLSLLQRPVVSGDRRVDVIAAASIVAKVIRDRIMVKMDSRYPQYGFAEHKGYPTNQHLEALKTYGPCSIHRSSFAPVRLYSRDCSSGRGDSGHEDRTA